jgi:hypothetical protein
MVAHTGMVNERRYNRHESSECGSSKLFLRSPLLLVTVAVAVARKGKGGRVAMGSLTNSGT